MAEAVAAQAWLAAHRHSNGKVGAVGFCWGGGLVNRLAVADPDLAAGVAYYGRQPDAADVPKIKAALLLHYAGLDERINAGIPAFRKALEEAGVTHEIYVYDGVNHAFNNDTSSCPLRQGRRRSRLAADGGIPEEPPRRLIGEVRAAAGGPGASALERRTPGRRMRAEAPRQIAVRSASAM